MGSTQRALPLSSRSCRRGLRSAGRWCCPSLPSGGYSGWGTVKGALRPALRLSERESAFGQAGAAALDRIGPGGNGVASVVAADHSADRQQDQPEDQVRDRIRDHGSALQLERFAHGDEGRRPAAVVDNVPVLRGTERGHVFRAGKTPFHPVGRGDRAPHSSDLLHHGNYGDDSRRAAYGARCGSEETDFPQFATGPADRAVAVQWMRLVQILARKHRRAPPLRSSVEGGRPVRRSGSAGKLRRLAQPGSAGQGAYAA